MTACGAGGNSTDAKVSSVEVSDVVVYTEVTPGGQFPTSLVVTAEGLEDCQITAEDFVMEGKATNWMDPSLHDFTANFTDATVEGNKLTLTFGDFKDKYFFVDSFVVNNTADERLSFTSDLLSQVVTPVADEFERHGVETGDDFEYEFFAPKTADGPLPLVVVFHGFGDTNNLRAYRTSLAWAEEEAQKERPCYVLSPIMADDIYYQDSTRAAVFPKIYEKINALIDEGKVDANRVYIMGNSFGGMSTIEFIKMYPDLPAGALALCSALNYSKTAMNDLEGIVNIPIWIAAAENDGTIPSENSKNLYNKLEELGAKSNKITIYSDEEMNAAGGSSDPNSTFSYHHVEMAVMEDEAYAKWLFEQN